MTNPNDNVPTTTSVLSVAEAEDAALLRSTAVPRSQARIVWGRFLRHRAATISAVVLIIVTLLSFTSVGAFGIPGWWPHDYRAAGDVIDGGAPTLSLIPTWLGGDGIRIGDHPFGQENTGKDYFALTMMGAQRSITIGLVLGITSTAIGSIIGAVAGYYRGWVDSVLMRITDLFIVIPLLALAAVVGQIAGNVGKNPIILALMLSLLTWTGLARLVRGEVLSLRERDFVLAARASGAGGARIIFRHLMPNVVGVIAVNATFAIAGAILLESSLSYLGFGVQAPETSLGLLISQYQGSFVSRPWLFWWPGMMILAIALSINFLGDGIRDAFDPRQSRSVRREIKRRNRA